MKNILGSLEVILFLTDYLLQIMAPKDLPSEAERPWPQESITACTNNKSIMVFTILAAQAAVARRAAALAARRARHPAPDTRHPTPHTAPVETLLG